LEQWLLQTVQVLVFLEHLHLLLLQQQVVEQAVEVLLPIQVSKMELLVDLEVELGFLVLVDLAEQVIRLQQRPPHKEVQAVLTVEALVMVVAVAVVLVE
jgi:hypothetical protein